MPLFVLSKLSFSTYRQLALRPLENGIPPLWWAQCHPSRWSWVLARWESVCASRLSTIGQPPIQVCGNESVCAELLCQWLKEYTIIKLAEGEDFFFFKLNHVLYSHLGSAFLLQFSGCWITERRQNACVHTCTQIAQPGRHLLVSTKMHFCPIWYPSWMAHLGTKARSIEASI